MPPKKTTETPKASKDSATAYINMLIYAALSDRDSVGDIESKYSEFSYQSYKNLMLPEKEKADNVKNRFAITPDVKKTLSTLFTKFIEEVKNIQIVSGDNIDSVITKLETENTECYSSTMLRMGKLSFQFGSDLIAATDATHWFQQQIVGSLPEYAGKLGLVGVVSDGFNAYLKGLSWLIGTYLWFTNSTSISMQLFQSILAMGGLDQALTTALVASLPVKPTVVRKKPEKKDESATIFSDEVKTETSLDTAVDAALAAAIEEI